MMKVFQEHNDDFLMSDMDTEAKAFHIENSSKMILTILDNAYSDPVTATIREICQNASEVDPTFNVHLPTDIEPWLAIVDNGGGLEPDELVRLASGVGASTKDGDNTKVGGFGIGMKVPFTMSDQYTIINRYGGRTYTYSAYKDEFGEPQFRLLLDKKTEVGVECGIEVRVPVESREFSGVRNKIPQALNYFNPRPTTNTEVDWVDIEYIVEGVTPISDTKWGVAGHDRSKRNWPEYEVRFGRNSRVIMGNLYYEIDSEQVREDYGDVYDRILGHAIDLYLPIGSVQLPLSREAILYTPATLARIRGVLDEVRDVLAKEVQTEVDSKKNPYEVMKFMHDTSSFYSRILKDCRPLYKGVEARHHMELPYPCSEGIYIIQPDRLALKSLNMQQHRVKPTKDGKIMFQRYSKDYLPMLVHKDSKRVPSRLLQHYKDTQAGVDREEKTVVLLFVYNDTNLARMRRYIYATFGWKCDIFDDVVGEYKTPKGSAAVKRKVARVKEFSLDGYMGYNEGIKDMWLDHPDLDTSTSRGIYVDIRNGYFHECRYKFVNPEMVRGAVQSLKDAGFIPSDTKLFGIPGSHKNKLQDSCNFMHLDDCIDTALELGHELLSKKDIRQYSYHDSLNRFISTNNNMFKLDIDVDNSYYTKLCSHNKTFKNSIRTTSNYSIYNSLSKLNSLIRGEAYVDYEDQIESKFFSRYPLLNHLSFPSYYDGDELETLTNDTQDYINLKTNCKLNI